MTFFSEHATNIGKTDLEQMSLQPKDIIKPLNNIHALKKEFE